MHMHQALDLDWMPERFCPGGTVNSYIADAFQAAASQPHIPLHHRVLRRLAKLSRFKAS